MELSRSGGANPDQAPVRPEGPSCKPDGEQGTGVQQAVASEEGKFPQMGEGHEDDPNGPAGDAPALVQSQNDALVLHIPEGARIPDDATFYDGPDDTRCRLIKADGERCRSTRTRATGLCMGHSGGGIAANPSEASLQAHAERRRRAQIRATLGISSRGAAAPLQMARIRAQERAEAYAEAVVDGPLDDPELGTVARQQAAIRALELLYPQASLQAEVTLPSSSEDVAAMGWQEMQALAASLVTSGDQEALEPA